MENRDDSKQLKILYVAHERKLGGATKSLIALIDEMILRGHEVCAVVPTSNCPIALELRKRDVRVIACFFGWWVYPLSWNLFLEMAFRFLYMLIGCQVRIVQAKLKKAGFEPDVIHTNSSVTNFGARLAKKYNCPHVWHVREYCDVDYNLGYMTNRKSTWDYMNANSDRMLFISKDVYEYFKDVADKDKSIVVYNGISQEYSVENKCKDSNDLKFLLSANINRSKNQMLVLKAIKILKDKGYTGFHLDVAGTTSIIKDSCLYEEELKAYVDSAGIAQHVSFLGKVGDMISLRAKADVEIVPSKREAFGRVTVEAMLAKMPVIASDSGANSELVVDGVTGKLFACDDEVSLADAMGWYLDNRDYVIHHGQNGYDRACKYFLASENASNIEDIYYELIR